MRRRPPFRDHAPDGEASLWFQHAGANKSRVTLDLSSARGHERLLALAQDADVLIESFHAQERRALDLDYEALRSANPELVVTSITGFGLTGPHADYRASDLVAMATGGMLYVIGDPERPPCVAPYEQAYGMGALHAVFATLVALAERDSGAGGQLVDISLQEVAAHLTFAVSRYSALSQVMRRTGPVHQVVPNAPFPASDGYVSISIHDEHMWPRFVNWLSIDELRGDEFRDRTVRADAAPYVEPLIAQATARKTRQELTEEGQALRLAVAPVNTVAEFVESAHVREHNLFREVGDPVLGSSVTMPVPLGYGRTPPRLLRLAPIADEPDSAFDAPREPSGHGKPARLSGIRVLDLTRVWAGPFCTRLLADFGAEVIRVESLRRPDSSRVVHAVANTASEQQSRAMFSELNRNKRSITLDLSTADGRELGVRLAQQCDVVVDNLAPGVATRLGLGYDQLAKTNPAIITLSMPAFGSHGPLSEYVGYGSSLMAYSGMMSLWGLPDTEPESLCHLAYPDYVTAAFGAVSVTAALAERARFGVGQPIELAQCDIHAWLMAPAFLEYLSNGVEPPRTGNSSRFFAPHNVYRCRGDDAWVAIACESDADWRNLVTAIGSPAWARQPAFEDVRGRLAGAQEIDDRIAEWTSEYSAYTAMRLLQSAGVPAGAVQSGEDLYRDPHLRERGYLVAINDPEAGRMTNPGLTARLSVTPGGVRRPAPPLGEANDYVFGELLGIPRDEIQALVRRGVVR